MNYIFYLEKGGIVVGNFWEFQPCLELPPDESSEYKKPCEHKYILLSSKRYTRCNDATSQLEQFREDIFYCEKCLDYKTKRHQI